MLFTTFKDKNAKKKLHVLVNAVQKCQLKNFKAKLLSLLNSYIKCVACYCISDSGVGYRLYEWVNSYP